MIVKPVLPYPALTLRRSPSLVVFWLQRYFANVFGGDQADVGSSGLYCVDLLSYLDFLCLIAHVNLVLTDSGGIKEEATILVVPCVTIRENTERPITITQETNVLAEVSAQSIIAHAEQKVNTIPKKLINPQYCDGKVGAGIVNISGEQIRRKRMVCPQDN